MQDSAFLHVARIAAVCALVVAAAHAAGLVVSLGSGGLAWETRASMPVARSELPAAALGSFLFLTGGLDSSGGTVGSVEVYDAGSDTWTFAPPLSVRVNHPMVAAAAGTVFVFGGYRGPAVTRK